MRIPRIHHPAPIQEGDELELEPRAAQHVAKVLRLKGGAPLLLFTGEGGQYAAELAVVERRRVTVRIAAFEPLEVESPLAVTLLQGISKGERMDYAVQKAVELGAARIVPLFTERSAVELKGERLEKRLAHWRGIAVAACEQSGRNRIPQIAEAQRIGDLLGRPAEGFGLTLDPRAGRPLAALPPPVGSVSILIGPEGGLTDQELRLAEKAGYHGVLLGPRVLRTETAAAAALTAVQLLWGDLR
ncbi:16S rRNA (uracil(1498)-N(3))-methyltransferase [Endothiovibrio diazotrophicus]